MIVVLECVEYSCIQQMLESLPYFVAEVEKILKNSKIVNIVIVKLGSHLCKFFHKGLWKFLHKGLCKNITYRHFLVTSGFVSCYIFVFFCQ